MIDSGLPVARAGSAKRARSRATTAWLSASGLTASGFAAATCLGSLAGAASEAGFVLAYTLAARRFGWPAALAAGSMAYALCAFLFASAALPLWPVAAVAVGALIIVLVLMPRPGDRVGAGSPPPGWDIPARMIVAALLVLGLTALAPHVGPRLSGLFATYPVFAAVLAAFSQHRRGAAAATRVLRGLLVGLFAFTAFFVVLAKALVPLGIAASFAAATLAALAVQGGSFAAMRRPA